MIKHVRQFFARIVDTRVSEAVIDLHRSMQHLEINNDERHKELMARLTLVGDNAHNAVIAVKENIDVRATESERIIIQKICALSDQGHDNQVAVRGAIVENADRIRDMLSASKPVAAKPPVPPAPDAKKPFIGRELKNVNLKNSIEWQSMPECDRSYFVAMVKDRFKDIELQGCFEEALFRNYKPVVMMLSHMRIAAADFAEKEVL